MSYHDFFISCLKNEREKVLAEKNKWSLCSDDICSLIRGGANEHTLSLIIKEENELFFEQAVISNKIKIFKFLCKTYPNFLLKNKISHLFFYAFVENKNWEMTNFLEEQGFSLVENLSAFFVMSNRGENFKNYCSYKRQVKNHT